eukprot:gene8138-12599_t
MKTNIILLLLITLFIYQGKTKEINLRILHFGDLYQLERQNGIGGLSELKSVLNYYKSNSKYHLTTFGGDFIPSMINNIPITSIEMLEYLEELNIDIGTFGNHELDIGEENLLKIIKNSQQIEWISSNIYNKTTMKPILKRYKIINIENISICFLTYLTSIHSKLNNSTKNIEILKFESMMNLTLNDHSLLKCDFRILLSHSNLNEDFEIIKKYSNIDIILGAHDHFPFSIFKKNKLILKSGKNAKYLSVLDLKLIKNDIRKLIYPSWKLIANNKKKKNLKLFKKIKKFKNKIC